MKTLLFFFLFINTLLFSSDLQTEEKIYKLIIHNLIPQQKEIKAWGDTPKNQEILKTIPGVTVVTSPKTADFLLLNNKKASNSKALIFVTNFKLLEKMQNIAVGGFYWQKGRPNILFLRQNLQKNNIHLPKSMQDFIEDEI